MNALYRNSYSALKSRSPVVERLFYFNRNLHAGQSGREKVVILGGGWAGYRVATDLDKKKFDVKLVSPRNYFLFTPLLPSTAVGTLEFRAIEEPIRMIRGLSYYQAFCESISFDNKSIQCRDAFFEGKSFSLEYDKLIIACGSESNTFGIKGVKTTPHVFFLKQLEDARAIRNRMIECFELASSPGCSPEERKKFLTFVIVGGGPTSIELSAEIYDFLKHDVTRCYPELFSLVKIKVIEATPHILGSFNSGLVSYVEGLLKSRNIELMTNIAVADVVDSKIILKDKTEIPFGMVVWSTGNKQLDFIAKLSGVKKAPNGRIIIDDHLRAIAENGENALGGGNVFALGDCAVHPQKALPLLAQVASQQASYLSKALNKGAMESPFLYTHLVSVLFNRAVSSFSVTSYIGIDGEYWSLEGGLRSHES